MTEVDRVIGAVAKGDLTQHAPLEVEDRALKGLFLRTAKNVNTMVDLLSSFAGGVTRVAREVGTEGKLGGQADVRGVAGVWKQLTDNVNGMAADLTQQVRGIARTVTAIANGDLTQKLALQAKGEIAELAHTINGMVDTLSAFAGQVTGVAREVGVEGKLGGQAEVPGAAGTWRDLTDNVNELAGNLTTQVRAIGDVTKAVTEGDFMRTVEVEARGEVAALRDNINEMITTLKGTTAQNEQQNWLQSNLAKFGRLLQGQRDLLTVGKTVLSELAPLVSVQHGVFYIVEGEGEKQVLKLLASYAYNERKHISNQFKVGEGLVGQCAYEKERILLTDVPGDYVQIGSALGEAKPLNIAVLPVLFEGKVTAVVELASFNRFTDVQLTFLEQLTENVGIVLNTIAATARTEELLKESQAMSEELQNQQEELQQSNEELEEKAKQLEDQNVEVERKNRDVEEARLSLQDKAEQLALTSKYKSEFLANMSHELRTPLNSLLILAKVLGDNKDGNLTPKQIEFAQTIRSSGADLLGLINDILDLAKIESGTMAVAIEDVRFADLKGHLERGFRQVAEQKGLDFTIELSANLPEAIRTDQKRLQQVLKNLLSNAFKFTQEGQVAVTIDTATEGWTRDHEVLNRADTVIAFAVSDTGVGIPQDKQKVIFEAFQQADGSAGREYGGTGLGLSISREIARLLGGEVRVESTPGQGSTFTLYLPRTYVPPKPTPTRPVLSGTREDKPPAGKPAPRAAEPEVVPANEVGDDRDQIRSEDKVLLIVEDDVTFARILLDTAREKGFKGLVALTADAGLALARQFKPDAITLDIRLPDRDGWVVLDRLKHDLATRHIPVHIISVEDDRRRGLELGAFAYLNKPADKGALDEAFAKIEEFVQRRVKSLLVVEDDEAQRKGIVELIGNGDVEITPVATGKEALVALQAKHFDCVVLDLMLPDMTGFQLIREIEHELGILDLPIIVYTGKELTEKEEAELRRVAEAVIVKDVKSPERLLDEAALFLHRVEENLPEAKRKMIEQVHREDPALSGKKVLIVDDDVRNIFAITATLEQHNLQVAHAETAQEGIKLLREAGDFDVVLMDIMMPGMDGFEAMREIRKIKRFASLPIIAVTAKAMKGDREKCIEAGASDYIAKPVDTEQLVSLLRVWLYEESVKA